MKGYVALITMALLVAGCDSASKPEAKNGGIDKPTQAQTDQALRASGKQDQHQDLLPYDPKVDKEAAAVVKHSNKKPEKWDPHQDLF